MTETEARTGQITDENALFSGISAEGRVGDWKIYNNRVQFIVQGDRPGDYYVDYPGVVVDADVVREADEVGQEFIDEWTSVVGLGRLLKPDTITVSDCVAFHLVLCGCVASAYTSILDRFGMGSG